MRGPHTGGRLTIMLVLLVVSATGCAPCMAQETEIADRKVAESEWWKGAVDLPGMPSLDYVVVFRPTEAPGQYGATLDVPAQGAAGLPLIDVKFTKTEIAFTLGPPSNAVHTLTRSEDGRTATGQLAQHGMTFPMRMERITEEEAKTVGRKRSQNSKPAGLNRPQTPKPPFPYEQREATYENPSGRTQLAGTLTIPEGQGPHPAVILITGSGAQDRDETIFDHKPFFVIADHLTRNGIAVLRVDDRGVGGSSRGPADPTSADFAGDVRAGMAYLKKQTEIDGGRIGLLGHSEGGVIAPLVASGSNDVARIVMLAGTGVPGDQILRSQNEAALRAAGATPEQVRAVVDAYDVVLKCLKDGADDASLQAAVRELITAQLAAQSVQKKFSKEELDVMTRQGVAQFNSAWIRWFIAHDLRETLRQVKCPVLALNGSLDLQVMPKENLAAIEQAARAGGNTDVTVRELPGLNHLFQEAKLGTVAEYGEISQTISPKVLEEVTAWLRTRLGLS